MTETTEKISTPSQNELLRYSHIFILTYGRSGSTLLQGILNSIPGVIIRGENNATLRPLINAWARLCRAKEIDTRDTNASENPWFGIGNSNIDQFGLSLASVFREVVLCPPAGVSVVGFKEIRYFPSMCQDLDREIIFMSRYFKRSCFIINTRNLKDTYDSIRRVRQNVSEKDLIESDQRLKKVAKLYDNAFHVHYDDYKDNPMALSELFEFLGATFDSQSVSNILSRTHSSRKR